MAKIAFGSLPSILHREKVSVWSTMEVGLDQRKGMVEVVLEKLNEAFTWVKTQVTAFFKLLSEKFVEALLGVKSLVINCCEKFKEALAAINGWIDAKTSEINTEEKQEAGVKESTTVDELQKLIQKTGSFAGSFMENADPDLKLKGEKVKWVLDLVEGLMEVVKLGIEQPLKPLLIFLAEYMIYRRSGNQAAYAEKLPQPKGKAEMFMRTLISLPQTFYTTP